MVLEEDLRTLAKSLRVARTAADVVGADDADRAKRVKQLQVILHPDKWVTSKPPLRHLATEAFATLQKLLAEEASKSTVSFDITTRTRTYAVGDIAFTGTVGNLYRCQYERGGAIKTGLLKLPRSVHDNDLIIAEATALKKIWATKKRRTAYFPRLEDAFKHRDKTTHIERQGVVTRQLDGFVSLARVREVYPDGLDARDLAWIWRRGLAALSLLNELEIVHGAILPEHVLIHPIEHGVQFCGFTSSVMAGNTIKVLGGSKWLYAPEVLKKEPATSTVDTYMFHKTMHRMLRPDAPSAFRAFINGVCQERPATRPQDPRVVLGDFDTLLERAYGPRKFRVFPPMPGVTT